MKEGKTLVQIWEDRQGGVHADFEFANMDRVTALKVNLRLDQLKAQVLAGFDLDVGFCESDDPTGDPDV